MQSVNREMKSDPFQIFQMKERGRKNEKMDSGAHRSGTDISVRNRSAAARGGGPGGGRVREIGVNREMRRQDWMEKQKAAGENGRR